MLHDNGGPSLSHVSRRRTARGRGRRTGWERGSVAFGLLVSVLVVAALVLGTAAAWSTGRLNGVICGGECGPEAIAAPESLARGAAPDDTTVPRPEDGPIDAAAVEQALSQVLQDDDLGGRVGVAVVDPATGAEVLTDGPEALVPASTTKILTAAAALATMDLRERFTTSVHLDGESLVLVGGGDPFLATEPSDEPGYAERADLTTLAERTAVALEREGVTAVTLGHDASLFTGPSASGAWEDGYVPNQIVTPVSALWADQGVSAGRRASDPADAAARTFARLLREEGVDVADDVTAVEAPDGGPLAQVRGATVAQVVESLMLTSNNEAAEVLLRHVAIAGGENATFEGGAAAVAAALTEAGLPVPGLELGDGSGLSRGNRISPLTLASTIAASMAGQQWPDLLSGLPVGGFSGTLTNRYETSSGAGAGIVRAKTGTLTGVHSLAGLVTDARGVPLAFAVMADDTEGLNPLETQAALDAVAAALATCTCG